MKNILAESEYNSEILLGFLAQECTSEQWEAAIAKYEADTGKSWPYDI